MSRPEPTKEEYDSLIYKLATLEAELSHARNLLEAPAKSGWWRRFWGLGVNVAAVALMALLLILGVSHALTLEQQLLVGLKGVNVLVEGMNPQAERLGLTAAQIKTDIELRLRKAGVRVLTKEENMKTPGSPVLYVNVNAIVGQNLPLVTYSSHVALKEWVTLARGGETYGDIWKNSVVGTVGIDKITQIRGGVGDLVDIFINDYLAANPK
jgi:hypothetical protein